MQVTKKIRNLFLSLLSGLGLSGCSAPRISGNEITEDMPFYQMSELEEFDGIFDDLMLGNDWLYKATPKTMTRKIPAWNTKDCVYGMKSLSSQAKSGVVHYEIYFPEKIQSDQRYAEAGLYCLHSQSTERKPYVLLLAGGGFSGVCTPVESLPAAAKFNELGYTAFAMTYRISSHFGKKNEPDTLMEDIAAAVRFIEANSEELSVLTDNYLIGGFSAGSVAVNMWGNKGIGYDKWLATKPGCICLMYGIETANFDTEFPKTFVRFCKDDQYFDDSVYTDAISYFNQHHIRYDGKKVDCLHGFGLGSSTDAEGWVNEAISFWNQE